MITKPIIDRANHLLMHYLQYEAYEIQGKKAYVFCTFFERATIFPECSPETCSGCAAVPRNDIIIKVESKDSSDGWCPRRTAREVRAGCELRA
jgi:hypothetical protein